MTGVCAAPAWNAGFDTNPFADRMSLARNRKFKNPCWVRSAIFGKLEKSWSEETAVPMSSAAKPDHFVAQNTKSCSFDMALTLPAFTSSLLPSRPWPYTPERAGCTGSVPLAVAARGMLQMNDAVKVPLRVGRPLGPLLNTEPGAPVPVR